MELFRTYTRVEKSYSVLHTRWLNQLSWELWPNESSFQDNFSARFILCTMLRGTWHRSLHKELPRSRGICSSIYTSLHSGTIFCYVLSFVILPKTILFHPFDKNSEIYLFKVLLFCVYVYLLFLGNFVPCT